PLYTLCLHDALPISIEGPLPFKMEICFFYGIHLFLAFGVGVVIVFKSNIAISCQYPLDQFVPYDIAAAQMDDVYPFDTLQQPQRARKSPRLNSSHVR